MTSERITEMLGAKPFRPFDVNLADGDSVRVAHPEFAALSPMKRTMVVFTPDDRMKIIDLLLVTSLEPANGSRKRKSRGR